MSKSIKISVEGLSEDTLKQIGLYTEMSEKAKAAQEANKKALDGLVEFAGKSVGLGDALKDLSGGPVGIALALADVATKYVNDYCAAIQQASDDQDKLNLDQHAASISKLAASWNQAVMAQADFNAALSTAGGQGDPTQKQIENAGQVATAEEDAARRTIAAVGAIQEARLRAAGAGTAAIAGVRANTQRELDERQIAQDSDPVTALQAEQKTRAGQDGALRTAARTAMDNATTRKKAVDDIQTKLAEAQKRVIPGGELDKAVDAATEKLDVAQAMDDDIYLAGPNGMGTKVRNTAKDEAMNEARGRLKVANTDRDVTHRRIDRLKKELPDAEYDADMAAAQADKKKAEAITNAGRLQDLPEDIAQAQKVAAVNKERDLATATEHMVAADLEAGSHIEDARSKAEAIKQQQYNIQLTRQLTEAARQASASHSETLTSILELLQQITEVNTTLQKQIAGARFNNI